MDIEMMIYMNLSFQVSLAMSHIFSGCSLWRPSCSILNHCSYLMFLDDCSYLCRMLPISDTNVNWQREAITDISLCTYASTACWENISVLCLSVSIELRFKTWTFGFVLFFQCWVLSSGAQTLTQPNCQGCHNCEIIYFYLYKYFQGNSNWCCR